MTEAARALVTGQMIADIVIVGLGVRIIVDAVKRGQRRQPIQAGSSAPTRCRWHNCGQNTGGDRRRGCWHGQGTDRLVLPLWRRLDLT
jgi:hypothetical protein